MKQYTVAICGCGSRGIDAYSAYQKSHPERMKIVACADIRPDRLKIMQEEFGVPAPACYPTGMEMLSQGKLADFVVIAVQDRDHVAHAIKAMEQGYDVICEKPISPDLAECVALQDTVHATGRKVLISHVLRYAPFFTTMKTLIDDGRIGEIMNVDLVENVQFWHMAHSFVRGNWRRSDETSPMILAKSCHDMDILRWLVGRHCTTVSSFGELSFFNASHAPEGSAGRCYDCKYLESCLYSAKRRYIDDPVRGVLHGGTGWPNNVVTDVPTEESMTAALKAGPYGRCVFRCDNDVVDHQVVSMKFEGGAIATFTMSAFNCGGGGRVIRIMGTEGEIEAYMSDSRILLRRFDEEEQEIPLGSVKDRFAGHGGGDNLLLESFMALLDGETDEMRTSVDASVESHVMALAAEYSRTHNGEAVDLDEFVKTVR